MTTQVRNPLACASPLSGGDSGSVHALSAGDSGMNRVASSLNLYKIIGDAAFEVVWEQEADRNAELTFSGDVRFAVANRRLTWSEIRDLTHPDDLDELENAFDALRSGAQKTFARRIRTGGANGEWLPIEMYAQSLCDADGAPRYIVGGFRDSTVELSSVRSSPMISDVIWERGMDGGFAVSANAEALLGHPRSRFQSVHDLISLLHPDDMAVVRRHMDAITTLSSCSHLSVRLRHGDGAWRLMDARVAALRDAEGNPDRIIGALHDATPQSVRELPAIPPAHSSLTALYTLEAGQAIIERNLLSGLNLQALILVEFRNLDEIEFRRGKRWRDLYLQHAASLVRRVCRENDVPVHYGDEAFLLFADQYETLREVTDLARNLHRMLAAPCAFDGEKDTVSFSLGIAIAPYDALSFSGLVERAAEACCLRPGVNFFDKEAADRFRLDSELMEEERRREKEQMREALRTIMDNVDAYLLVIHPLRHEILFANKQIRDLRPECVPGSLCYSSFFKTETPCDSCSILCGQDCLIEKDGQQIYLQLRHKRIRWLNDEMVYLVSGTDVTERMLHARKLEHMAYHDALLDIPNRLAALKNLQHFLKDGTPCAVVLLDISDFKLFNETFGHAKGDLLLKDVSLSIARFVPEGSLYRSGGDDFLIILPGASGERAQELAETIRDSFNRVLSLENLEYTCNLDVGISVSPQHGTTPSTLITHAELALAEARKEGRGIYLFNKELDQILSRKKLLQVLIRSALANGDFEVHFQPVFEIRTGLFHKAEALLRLRDGAGNFISPAEFIPVAEETGLIVDVGYLVLDTVCRQLLAIPAVPGRPPFQIAVNISAIQLLQTNFASRVMEIIRYHGVDAQQLEFEVTESVLINSFEQVKAVMQQLQEKGIRFALDDFGTGYSSLSYLTHLPISTLKLDRSFIKDLEASDNNRQVCKAVIDIARHFNMTIVAEGVENAEQAKIISELGATSIQGFYYARPLPGGQLVPWLSEREVATPPKNPPRERESRRWNNPDLNGRFHPSCERHIEAPIPSSGDTGAGNAGFVAYQGNGLSRGAALPRNTDPPDSCKGEGQAPRSAIDDQPVLHQDSHV